MDQITKQVIRNLLLACQGSGWGKEVSKGVSRESGLRGVGGQGLCQSWSMTKSVNDQVGQLLFNRVGQ